MEDREIIDLYWARSEQAVAETQKKYGSYCRTIAHNILHSPEDAEECVNDTCLAAWRAMPPDRPRRLDAWLGRITRNLALNRLKGYSAEKRGLGQGALALSELEDCVPGESGVEGQMNQRELARAIEDFLRGQPAERRSIFIRRYWYLTPVKEIAEAYRMSESKAASLLFRMRNELRRHLEKEGITL